MPREGQHHQRPLRIVLPARFGTAPFLVFFDVVALVTVAGVLTRSWLGALVFTVLAVALFAAGGLYRSKLSLSILDDAPALVGRVLVAVVVTYLVHRLAGASLLALITAAPFIAAAVLVERTVSYAAVRACRCRGWVAHRTLLLGAGKIAGQIAEVLTTHPEYGLELVGFLDANPLLPADQRRVPLLGGHEALAETIRAHHIRVVIVAFGSMPESEMIRIIWTCDRHDCEMFFVPRLFELTHHGRDVDHLWGLPLVRRRRGALGSAPRLVKRGFDTLVAGVALLALFPLMLLIALVLCLESGPHVLFRQERVGADGRRFVLIKFRTLRPEDATESSTRWSLDGDARLTALGRFLRRTSLDELPQLVNILRGDMSLVGPRPERPYFVRAFADSYPHYIARHRVPSGLTGWAQVHGLRGDTSIDDRARFDNVYIESWSLWGDVKILLRTVLQVLRPGER